MKISLAQLWVQDQDEALDFYTCKLGMETRTDVTMPEFGGFRWLAVGPVAQPDMAIVLMAMPSPPVADKETAAQIRDLTAKGYTGQLFLATDDIRAAVKELAEHGIEFTEELQERSYGIDAAFRDPSGNHIRITQNMSYQPPK